MNQVPKYYFSFMRKETPSASLFVNVNRPKIFHRIDSNFSPVLPKFL